MCGIVGGVGRVDERGLTTLNHRGPDHQDATEVGDWWIGHTRLAILDLDARSNQPMRRGKVTLAFNGEIWNYRELRAELQQAGHEFVTEGDTEVVAVALDAWGPDALPRLNGMFALAWHDGDVLRLSRDRYGEVPLHYHFAKRFMFASEVKALNAMDGDPRAYRWVEPGEVIEVRLSGPGRGVQRSHYHSQGCAPVDEPRAPQRMRELIGRGASERSISDVPVCTLLSGGIDSSAVAYHLRDSIPGLICYTAVMDPRSPDLKQARAVASVLGLELREVQIKPPSPDDLAEVIRVIEMPHKAQVEIGWACLALARRMHEDGFRVCFSGEGADELMGSYGFVDHALREGKDWHATRRDLFMGQHRKNFARCNKVFMSSSVECRLPFLHPPLVDFALSLRIDAIREGGPNSSPSKRKRLMALAYSDVPGSSRPKLAFHDGLGLKSNIADRMPEQTRYYRSVAMTTYGKSL